MEGIEIQQVHICPYKSNCTIHDILMNQNVTVFGDNTALISKLHTWEDYVVAVYLLTIGKLKFLNLSYQVNTCHSDFNLYFHAFSKTSNFNKMHFQI